MNRRVMRIGKRSNGKTRKEALKRMETMDTTGVGKWELIQMLIPLGLEKVKEELMTEVAAIAGERYSRDDNPNRRWGDNPGSVYLGDQKVGILVPRVRDIATGKEVHLKSYEAFQEPRIMDDLVLKRVVNGISMRKYKKAALGVAQTFGIKRNTISRKWIKGTAQKLERLMSRDLKKEDIIAIVMDGKAFADTEIIVALGVTIEGNKMILGFIESGSENARVCQDFITDLLKRGLNVENEILFIVDGSKGLQSGIRKALQDKALIQRCQWHKRENVISYLPQNQQEYFRAKLQEAYGQKDYSSALAQLHVIRKELKQINLSAVKSLDEGLEESLTLHRLGIFGSLGRSFKTTNCIESIFSQVEKYTHRVTLWKNSFQKQRWLSAALIEIEPGLRKIKGYRALPQLRIAMKQATINKTAEKAA